MSTLLLPPRTGPIENAALLPESGRAATDYLYILDTDIFYDVDDAVAVALAAFLIGPGRLVIVTSDETRGRRAMLSRRFVRRLGRTDVTVLPGVDLAGDRFVLDHHLTGLTSDPQPDFATTGHLADLCDAHPGPVVWIGCGPLSNLAALLTARPDLADSIQLVMMGGWLDPARYRDPSRASHNLRVDPRAAALVLRLLDGARLVLSEHTGVPELCVTADHRLYRELAANPEPWARLIVANFDSWFSFQLSRGKPAACHLHDVLTLAAALGTPVTFADEYIRIGGDVRFTRDRSGRRLLVSTDCDYSAVNTWMFDTLCA
ncbi:nucleoside hydrolase [Nocardia sp. alder85J]|uniref:nucleoside hydrolase n=1 Tax=Nocardia sp. alder85J TaxID=2862949 RepID=UPI001CD55CC4|nr:nucleoside hydrolase [Nocardia sp. alder85J]MCX4099145.1 nucleoside hydrolase [Nocardia sp. alder85J]